MKRVGKFILISLMTVLITIAIPYAFLSIIHSDVNGKNLIDSNGKFYCLGITVSDVLTYYGSMLASIATIVAILIAFKLPKKELEKEKRLSIKPAFCSETELVREHVLPARDLLYVEISKGICSSSKEPPDYVNAFEQRADVKEELNRNQSYLDRNIIIKYTICNIGAGSALRIRLTIDGFDVIPTFGMAQNQSRTFMLFFDTKLLVNERHAVIIELRYFDVAEIAEYSQQESLTLINAKTLPLSYSQDREGLLSPPMQVEL